MPPVWFSPATRSQPAFNYLQWVAYVFMHRVPPALRAGMVTGAAKTLPYFRFRTRKAPKASKWGRAGAVASGRFMKGWESEPAPGGARIFNDVGIYAQVIDGGRRVGARAPPRWAILAWMRLKGIGQNATTRYHRGRRPRAHSSLSPSELRSVAFVISRAISKRGLRARKVLTGGLREAANIAMVEVERMLDRELATL